MRLPNGIWPIQRAQVLEAHPTGLLSVLLEDYSLLGAIPVRMARARAHPAAGEFALPELGDWGIVAFTRDDMRFGVWLGSLDDDLRNLIPEELWQADRYADLTHHPSDQRTIQHGDGTTETIWPDGSLLKLTTTKDGAVSNPSRRGSRTPRRMRRKTGPMQSERRDYVPHSRPPVDVEFQHSSGAIVRITADGSFLIRTPAGHGWRLHDATEKARDPTTGAVTARPEEDAMRVASQVALESQMGHRLVFNDDPQAAANDRFVRLTTALGHLIELRDLAPGDRFIRARTVAGNMLELRDTPVVEARLTTPGGRTVHLNDAGARTTITDPAVIVVAAPTVHLSGEGGPAVARVGDAVQVTISGVTHTGAITGGSTRVRAT